MKLLHKVTSLTRCAASASAAAFELLKWPEWPIKMASLSYVWQLHTLPLCSLISDGDCLLYTTMPNFWMRFYFIFVCKQQGSFGDNDEFLEAFSLVATLIDWRGAKFSESWFYIPWNLGTVITPTLRMKQFLSMVIFKCYKKNLSTACMYLFLWTFLVQYRWREAINTRIRSPLSQEFTHRYDVVKLRCNWLSS